MKILLSGGTGFLGKPLVAALSARGHEVSLLRRGEQPVVDGIDAVVNLAGESIAAKRWTTDRKEALRQSRILMTRNLVSAMRSAQRRPKTFISGSAVGYYGDPGDREVDESYPPGSDFLATLCVDWEAEARAATALGCRVVLVRTGVVLSAQGGALAKLLPPFKLFAGGPIASGRQYMSWIHLEDWIAMMLWLIDTSHLTDAVNATAPEPVTNEAFSQALGAALHRPSWLRVPGPALRLLIGEMATVALIDGQRVLPRRALEAGFQFKYARLDEALAAVLSGPRS